MTYGHEDRPENTTVEDLVTFWRAMRDEARTVGLETAGILAAKVSSAAVTVALRAAEWGSEWRTRADTLAPSLPVPDYWQRREEQLPQDDDDMHEHAEREAAKARHPSTSDRS